MKIWQKEWFKKIFIIALLIGINIFGFIFFGAGNFGILFATGLLAVFLDKNVSTHYNPIQPLIIFISTSIIYYLMFPIKFGDKVNNIIILFAWSLVLICFVGGSYIGYVISINFCQKKE